MGGVEFSECPEVSGGVRAGVRGCPDTLDQSQSGKVSGVRGLYKSPGPGQPGW